MKSFLPPANLDLPMPAGAALPPKRDKSRPTYFVVSRRLGRIQAAIYWDELPGAPVYELEYAVRLDTLSEDNLLRLDVPIARLLSIYATLKAAGTLPPRWEPPPKAKPAAAAEG